MEKQNISKHEDPRKHELKLKFDDIFKFLDQNTINFDNSSDQECYDYFSFVAQNCLLQIESEKDLAYFIDYITESQCKKNSGRKYDHKLHFFYNHLFFESIVIDNPKLLKFECISKLIYKIDGLSKRDAEFLFNMDYENLHPKNLEILKINFDKHLNCLMVNSLESTIESLKIYNEIVEIYNKYSDNKIIDKSEYFRYKTFLFSQSQNHHIYYYYERIVALVNNLGINGLSIFGYFQKFNSDNKGFLEFMMNKKKAYEILVRFDTRQKPNHDILYSVFDYMSDELSKQLLSFSEIKRQFIIKKQSLKDFRLSSYCELITKYIDDSFELSDEMEINFRNLGAKIYYFQQCLKIDFSFEVINTVKIDEIIDALDPMIDLVNKIRENLESVASEPKDLNILIQKVNFLNTKINQLFIYNNNISNRLEATLATFSKSLDRILKFSNETIDKINKFDITREASIDLQSKLITLSKTLKLDEENFDSIEIQKLLENLIILLDLKIKSKIGLDSKSLKKAPEFLSHVIYDLNTLKSFLGGEVDCNKIKGYLTGEDVTLKASDIFPKYTNSLDLIYNTISNDSKTQSNIHIFTSVRTNAQSKLSNEFKKYDFQIDFVSSENELESTRHSQINVRNNFYFYLMISNYVLPLFDHEAKNLENQKSRLWNWLKISGLISLIIYGLTIVYNQNENKIDQSQKNLIAQLDKERNNRIFTGPWKGIKADSLNQVTFFSDPDSQYVDEISKINPSLKVLKVIGFKDNINKTSVFFKRKILFTVEKIWLQEKGHEYDTANPRLEYLRYMVRNLLILHKVNEQKYILMIIDREHNQKKVQNIINRLGYKFKVKVGSTQNTGSISDILTFNKPVPTPTEYSIKIESPKISTDIIKKLITNIKNELTTDDLRFETESFEDDDYTQDQSNTHLNKPSTRIIIYVKPKLPGINITQID